MINQAALLDMNIRLLEGAYQPLKALIASSKALRKQHPNVVHSESFHHLKCAALEKICMQLTWQNRIIQYQMKLYQDATRGNRKPKPGFLEFLSEHAGHPHDMKRHFQDMDILQNTVLVGNP